MQSIPSIIPTATNPLASGLAMQIIVRLIVGADSPRQREGRLRPGGYLVGRSRGCQIRPTDRSVSRRHCLLLHHGDRVCVVDLGSSSGTFVNGARTEPGVQVVLYDGDELTLGSLPFRVHTSPVAESAKERFASRVTASASSSGSLLFQESADLSPMDSVDVATWLSDLDESDRTTRMAKLRSHADATPDLDDPDSEDEAEEAPWDEEDAPIKSNDLTIPPDDVSTDLESTTAPIAPLQRPTRPQPPKAPTKKAGRSYTLSLFDDSDRVKLVVFLVLALIALVAVGWVLYGFFSPGDAMRVVPGV